MAQSFARHTVSFVLRLWVESGEQPDEPQWRGQIEHVGSGEKAHFQDLSALQNTMAKFVIGFIPSSTMEPKKEA
ncbi:hypothetical protein HYR54_14400 [Candidatus Acetothermia bacterium]|nr:hypothetical protein [Candidatus Acetothermia bacterium]